MKNILEDEGGWCNGKRPFTGKEKLLYGDVFSTAESCIDYPEQYVRGMGGDWFFFQLLPQALPLMEEIDGRVSAVLSDQHRRAADDNSVAELAFNEAVSLAMDCIAYKIGGAEYAGQIKKLFPDCPIVRLNVQLDARTYAQFSERLLFCGMLMCRWIYESKFILERLGALDAELAAQIEETRKIEHDLHTEIEAWKTTAEMNARLCAEAETKAQNAANSTPATMTAGQAAKLMYSSADWTQYEQDTLYRHIQSKLDTMDCKPIRQAAKRGDKYYLTADIVAALKELQKEKYRTDYHDREFYSILSGGVQRQKVIVDDIPMAKLMTCIGKPKREEKKDSK